MTESRKITMDDLTIQAWPVERPQPAPNNHKKHTEETVAKLAKSLADIGQIQPIVVDKNDEIIAGHGRLMAAKKLGWSKIKVIQIPVDRATAIKARIADNLMSNQNIDQDKLATEINEVLGLEGDIDMSGLVMDDAMAGLAGATATEDFNMDLDAISDDLSGAVEEFTRESDDAVSDTDEGENTPLRRVFGFTKVSTRQARVLSAFMAQVCSETDEQDPAEALTKWALEIME